MQEMIQLEDGVFVATPRPGEGTMGVIVTAEAKVAIDTTSYDGFAAAVKADVDAQSPAPWVAVVLTHGHFDHIGGNRVFDAPIIASHATARQMAHYTPDWLDHNLSKWVRDGVLDGDLFVQPTIVMPDRLYEDQLSVDLGGVTLEIVRLGGHSEDSSVVYLPERRVLFAGDLVFNGRPTPRDGADLARWLQSLDAMVAMEPRLLVAGHGLPGGPELLDAQRETIMAMMAAPGSPGDRERG